MAGHCTCGRVPGWVFSVILWRKNTGSTTINEIYKLLFMNPVPLQRSIATRPQSWQQIFVGRFWPSGTHVQNPARLHVGKTQMALRSPHPVQDLGYLGWGSLQCRKVGMIGIKCGKTSHIFQEKLRLSIMFSLTSSLPYFAHAQCHTASASS